mmetsp:Transcript_8150/g.25763  ORF Transcript_8150/g.25763 Transcript_8150/m.25763 type:complete len:238 (-) Transcript_8150:836-1549(-)
MKSRGADSRENIALRLSSEQAELLQQHAPREPGRAQRTADSHRGDDPGELREGLAAHEHILAGEPQPGHARAHVQPPDLVEVDEARGRHIEADRRAGARWQVIFNRERRTHVDEFDAAVGARVVRAEHAHAALRPLGLERLVLRRLGARHARRRVARRRVGAWHAVALKPSPRRERKGLTHGVLGVVDMPPVILDAREGEHERHLRRVDAEGRGEILCDPALDRTARFARARLQPQV